MQVIIKLFQLYVIINHVFGNAKGSKAYLKSVILVPRHGERTALSTYDNDPNALYWMKYGFGSLTDNGEKRMRHLGEFLRKRYDSLWPEKEKIYVRSNRENRCIQSAEHLISGAYNEDFLSNPVKIHNVPIEEDIMMSFNAKCPVYDKELDRVFNLPDMKQWINSYANLIKYFEEKCGSDSVDSSLKVGGLFDNFCSIKENNLTTPIWLNDTIYNRTAEFIDRYFVELFRTTLQKRLRVGSFLAEIRNQINLIASNNTFDSVRIYSGTDILIGGIFSALGVSDNRRAPVGSAVMFEFYESDLYPKNFVRFYYLHDTYSERPNLLTIYNCLTDEMCSFEKFKKQIEKYIPNDWRYECGLK